MAMYFPYLPLPTMSPIPSLGGATVRYRPIVAVRLTTARGTRLFDGCVDSACDDTIYPRWLADKLHIDLANASKGEAKTPSGKSVSYDYAQVTLRLSDGKEGCEWEATVGFADVPLQWALLGHAGFLEFFDTEIRGQQRQMILSPNSSFLGQHYIFDE